MTIGFARFGKQFASGGTTTPLTDAQAAAGWGFIGSAPPTVEEFNAMMQTFDDKDNWLYSNIATVVTAAGTTAPADGVFTVLQTALNALYGAKTYAGVATGTANAILATLNPAPAALTEPLTVVIRVAANNTGATTINLNGLGVKNIVGAAHSPLAGGELVTNGFATLSYNTALGAFVLLYATGGAEQVGLATSPLQAPQLGQMTGRLLRTLVYQVNSGVLQVAINTNGVWTAFTATGASSYSPPAGVTFIEHECQASGGAGGGASPSNSTNCSFGGGGGGGTYARSLIPASAITSAATVTIGAPGVGGTPGASGTNAAASSFGALVTCPGGTGSGNTPATAGPALSGGTGQSAAATGAYVVEQERGGPGTFGILINSGVGIAGPGGASHFGPGPAAPSGTGNGITGPNAGSGGSGPGSGLNNTSGATGGNGQYGIQTIREYA